MTRTRGLSINCEPIIASPGIYNAITSYNSINPDNILLERKTKNVIAILTKPGVAVSPGLLGRAFVVNTFTSRTGLKSLFVNLAPKTGTPNSMAQSQNPITLYLTYTRYNSSTNTWSSPTIINDSYVTIPANTNFQLNNFANLFDIIPDATYTKYTVSVVFSQFNLIGTKKGLGLSVTLEYYGE